MKQEDKAVLFIAVIGAMVNSIFGEPVDRRDLVDSLHTLGFDSEELFNTPTVLALQKVCKAFSEIQLSELEHERS